MNFNAILTAVPAVLASASETGFWAGFDFVKALIIALVAGLLTAFLYTMFLKARLTGVYKAETSQDYTRDKSFKVEESRETFLYSKTAKTLKTGSNNDKKEK